VTPQRLAAFDCRLRVVALNDAIGAWHDLRLRIGEIVLILVLRFRLIRCTAFGRRFLPRSGLQCPFGLPDLL